MNSLNRLAGELFIDHSNSPGIPEELAVRWASRGVFAIGGSSKIETATWTCRHCNAIVIKNPNRTRPREVCRKCMAVVCDACNLNCIPFEQLAEHMLGNRPVRLDERTNLLVPA